MRKGADSLPDIYSVIDKISLSTKMNVLATLVQVEGSAYRKVGAWMVMVENGTQTGMISGGCVETDLSERFNSILRENKSYMTSYNLMEEDDLIWGHGNGCKGVIKVLLEPVHQQLRENIRTLKRELDQANVVTMIKKMTKDNEVTDYIFLSSNGHSFGSWQGTIPPLSTLPDQGLHYSCTDNGFLYVQQISPRPHLIVFGAGLDAIPLVDIANKTGFKVTVADWRPAYCNAQYFPNAHNIRVGTPSELISKIKPSKDDYVILMTHHFQKDEELLETLLKGELQYLGLLGSKERSKRLLKDYVTPAWVHYPVGLPIGAEGPNEIAISIVAEIIKTGRVA